MGHDEPSTVEVVFIGGGYGRVTLCKSNRSWIHSPWSWYDGPPPSKWFSSAAAVSSPGSTVEGLYREGEVYPSARVAILSCRQLLWSGSRCLVLQPIRGFVVLGAPPSGIIVLWGCLATIGLRSLRYARRGVLDTTPRLPYVGHDVPLSV